MKRIKNCFMVYLYVFIIFTSMLPNRENMTKVSELKTIFPGIDKIYDKEKNEEESQIKYSFKLFEILQNII
ncbi:MAG: hypothetical protein J6A15_03395 [Clostridia bacterium]|nr:hypothetical protein [Clostridia bacterium]